MRDRFDLPRVIRLRADVQRQVGRWQHALRFLGPLHELQARAGEQIPEACFFKFARISKAVQIEMPNVQLAMRRLHGVGLDHGVARALDAALHAEGAQQMAHKRRLASA